MRVWQFFLFLIIFFVLVGCFDMGAYDMGVTITDIEWDILGKTEKSFVYVQGTALLDFKDRSGNSHNFQLSYKDPEKVVLHGFTLPFTKITDEADYTLPITGNSALKNRSMVCKNYVGGGLEHTYHTNMSQGQKVHFASLLPYRGTILITFCYFTDVDGTDSYFRSPALAINYY